jgi:hypothetical protein
MHTVTHVSGYGYESTPNNAIASGACGEDLPHKVELSLGILALGNHGR